ncbi:MAG: hypothetical protein JWN08_2468 [Frankiales bacterium]|nr:hypothetical protein [Frankiales bacterium]
MTVSTTGAASVRAGALLAPAPGPQAISGSPVVTAATVTPAQSAPLAAGSTAAGTAGAGTVTLAATGGSVVSATSLPRTGTTALGTAPLAAVVVLTGAGLLVAGRRREVCPGGPVW